MVQKATFSVVFYPQKEGGYTVICPELPACVSEGDTYEQALANIKDLIKDLLSQRDDQAEFIEALATTGKIFTEVEITV